MKFFKYLSYLLIAFIVISVLLVFNRVFFAPAQGIAFISGLKSVPAKRVTYLPENNSTILPINGNTIGVYSVRKDNFFLKEIFQTAGTPYYLSHNLTDLNGSKIIFLDFNIDKPKELSKVEREFLYNFVSRGGTLIGNEILTTKKGVLKGLFGYMGFKASKMHHRLKLLKSSFYKYFDTNEEKNYWLSTIEKAPYTNAIKLGSAKAIATYEDNKTAISINHYGKGIAINLGMSLYDLRYRNLFSKDFRANKDYINKFEPLSDFIVLFIKGIYQQKIKQSLVMHTAKDGNQATLIMTHDIDFDNSMQNIPKFVKAENEVGTKATYNMQVKYITDDKDRAFFLPKYFKTLQKIEQDGFEFGSHTILHTKNFFILPKGTCKEKYPDYKPFSVSEFVDSGDPTACGEIKVSKELMLGAGIKSVVTFRSGELLYNPHLPEILEQFGYRYSSCFSAEDVLSYFPYRYMREYHSLSNPSKIWEIPLVLEDEFFPPLYFRVGKALNLFKKIYNNGGVYTILDHPDLTLYKLKNFDIKFIKSFYSQLPPNVWKATMREVGEYWDKRDRVIFRYYIKNKKLHLRINSIANIDGFTFELENIQLKPSFKKFLKHNKLVLNIKKGTTNWVFDIY